MRYTMTACCLLAFATTALGQRDLKNIPDPDPELERKTFQVAEGFDVQLFAADPLLAKPIQMNFDPQGRLWVASSETYPHIKPGEKANDKILIVEDRDGDGKADKVSTFADGLLIPTGVEPGDGGAYVANSTEMLHLRDTDGDGKADSTRVVLSGFGTEDTHHILHTFRWGPEGLLYMNQSVYIHSHIETPWGVRRLNGGGIWQFRPETMRLEVYMNGLWNTWGHTFDRYGQSFATDGAGGEGINFVIPGGFYAAAPGAPRIFPGLNPGKPKYCGQEVLSGRHLPADWQGDILTNDFRGHRVCRYKITPDGAGYAAREMPELIKSNHPAFRPIDIRMGPDGAIYIADWYNPIIQHGEVDFRDPRRDHTHGRIWRVTRKDTPLLPRPKLVSATNVELLNNLKLPEDWTRLHSKRVLKERGAKAVLPDLAQWVKALDPKDADYEHQRLEGLWVYQALDVVEPELLTSLLNATDHRIRAAATRVIGHWHDRLTNPLELLAARIADEHPQVRFEAARALTWVPGERSIEVAMRALDKPVDRFLDYALFLTARELAPTWLPAMREGTVTFNGNARHLLFALQAVGSAEVVQPLVALVKSGKVTGDRLDGVLTLLAQVGGPNELAMVFDRAVETKQPNLLLAIEQAMRLRKLQPATDSAKLATLIDHEGTRLAALRVAGLWKVVGLRDKLTQLATANDTAPEARQAAIDGLVSLADAPAKATLDQLTIDRPLAVRQAAIIGLAELDVALAAKRAADLLVTLKENDGSDAVALIGAFLQRKGGADALSTALQGKKLRADVAKLGQRAIGSSGRPAPQLNDALVKAGELGAPKRTFTADEMKEFLADVQAKGDPARGESIYRRSELACLKCHAIGDAGGQVGPNLSSIGASAQVDYLIESMLTPNKAIKENYHSVVVSTLSGKVQTGIKVRENKNELVIRDAEDRQIIIPTKDIDEVTNGQSLMPEGLVDSLTRQELLDLVRFLSELGKVGPYSLSKSRLVRRWEVLQNTPDGRTYIQRNGVGGAGGNNPALTWGPAYSVVAGDLPMEAIPAIAFRGNAPPFAFTRFQLDVTTAGKVEISLNGIAGMQAWLDGTPIELKERTIFDLKSGTHTLTFGIDTSLRKDPVRCELLDHPGSGARVAIIGGK